ncbi:hypothetical protein ASC77_17820 [Nocardioides sp. Root1257]|uniref:carboxypeptidase-like regulatory domain-containing protein n=1 Tax=unclassified Nocardioides TaxID=2615069 RepID=UPI0006FAAAD4|nr:MULTISPECIES: carboxypeptidase-like regulatory domain-containing protein [unclassified Nocardioides]KQW47042.1 hypothetical protein ASC77_17820 [Nocardioides sp. Root1257]KRC43787.1 hypothetical protein ASE24_18775 [Nocardioides sp. Root224]
MPRPLVAALSLLLGLGVASHAIPDSVDASALAVAADESTSSRLMPTRPERGRAWIEGTVVDRAGRLLDGIDVEAYDVDDLHGDPVASWQTYEDPEDGPEHGWFRLYGLTPGTYKVKISSAPGTPKKARYRTIWTRSVTVGNRDVQQLGSTAVTSVIKAAPRLTAALADATLKPAQAPQVRLGLTAAGVRPVLGSVRVVVDHRPGRAATFRATDRGRVTVALPRQSLGWHTATFAFAGNDAVAPSTKPIVVRFKVTRTGR